MMDTGLKHKDVLITGGNNPWGIGAATAHAFATEGAVVFATYLRLAAEVRATTVPGEALHKTPKLPMQSTTTRRAGGS
jgi:NAD(P)-dependent dehydrogenase (short-subunit alcohol dehydrogenase family)